MNKSFSIKGRHGPTFHRQRIFFIDRGNYEDGEKRKEKLSFVKKNVLCLWKIFSVCAMSRLWNVLSMKSPIYKMPYQWNVLSIKSPIYDIVIYEMSKRPIVSFHVFHFLKNKLLFLFLIFKQSSHFREKMRIFAFVFCEKNIFRKKVLYLKQLIVQKNLWNSLLWALSIKSFIIS